MNYPNVLAQLKQELKERERSKVKSIQSFERGSITKKVHNGHVKNLNILIDEYISAINKLN